MVRCNWTLDSYATLIYPVAKSQSDEWLKAHQPFQFLAACIEFVAACEGGQEYVTHLPISFDGSCSGLQHLCAMTRSEEGALVNLADSEEPQDIYRVVADKVRARLEAEGDPKGLLSLGIDRKLMKAPTGTYAYNVADYGINEQIRNAIEEKFGDIIPDPPRRVDLLCFPGRVLHALEETIFRPARVTLWEFSSDVVRSAIEETVSRPAEAMNFLRKCAEVLAKKGHVLEWTTPTGLPWANRYHEPKKKRVQLVLRGRTWKPTIADGYEQKIREKKTKNAAAANLVHALDASHLVRTVNACVSNGITNIATIHDCFACLAPQVWGFTKLIRTEFVRMYTEHDPLAEVRERALRITSEVPDLPEYGAFDLRQVVQASYAFA